MPIRIFMDAQFGSCGKGAVISALARIEHPDIIVRAGGPQAGHSWLGPCPAEVEGECNGLHTFVTCGIGKMAQTSYHIYKQRQVPVAWSQLDTLLIIGRGALVNLDVLEAEIEAMRAAGCSPEGRLWIDPQAFIVEKRAEVAERVQSFGSAGSTREGVGVTRAYAAMRTATTIGQLFFPDAPDEAITEDLQWLQPFVYRGDTGAFLREELEHGNAIWVEGTQGFGLSLRASGNYPFVTSCDITPQQLLADLGLHWKSGVRTTMLVRTYPIRIAGNSGPLDEIGWDEIEVPPAVPERTTVTNLQRRIGRFDMDQVVQAVEECEPDEFVVTFADYLQPDSLRDFVIALEAHTEVPVTFISHGFEDLHPRAEFWRSHLGGVNPFSEQPLSGSSQ